MTQPAFVDDLPGILFMRFALIISMAVGFALPIHAQTDLFDRTFSNHTRLALYQGLYGKTEGVAPTLHVVAFPSAFLTLKKTSFQFYAEAPLVYHQPAVAGSTPFTLGNVLMGLRRIAKDQQGYIEMGIYLPTFQSDSLLGITPLDRHKEDAFLPDHFALYIQEHIESTDERSKRERMTYLLRMGGILVGDSGYINGFHLLTAIGIRYQYAPLTVGFAIVGRATRAQLLSSHAFAETFSALFRQFTLLVAWQTTNLTLEARLLLPTYDTDQIPFSYGLVATVPLF